jgi:hypothetical protein
MAKMPHIMNTDTNFIQKINCLNELTTTADPQNGSLLLLNFKFLETWHYLEFIDPDRCKCFTNVVLKVIQYVVFISIHFMFLVSPHIRITEIKVWKPCRLQFATYHCLQTPYLKFLRFPRRWLWWLSSYLKHYCNWTNRSVSCSIIMHKISICPLFFCNALKEGQKMLLMYHYELTVCYLCNSNDT